MEIKCELFVPKATTQYNFGIVFVTTPTKNHYLVAIFEAPILQEGDGLKHGDEISLLDPTLLFELDVWRKYYFPKFNNNDMQWCHKESWSDDIAAMAEVMEYAREKAVNLLGGPI